MSHYRIETPDGRERGVRIVCEDHGQSEEFHPGYRTVAFHCDGCGVELELTLRDTDDWRELTELC